MDDRARSAPEPPLPRQSTASFDSDAALRCIADAVIVVDPSGRLRFMNAAAERVFGCPATAAAGRRMTELCTVLDGATREVAADVAGVALQRKGAGPWVVARRDGVETAVEASAAPVEDHRGVRVGTVLVLRDVGPTMRAALDHAHRALHDPLTTLPNRRLLRERLGALCAAPPSARRRVGVAFLDLNGLKAVNDLLGHDAGDYVLRSTAARLLAAAGRDDLVCRHGGDEFVVLFAHVTSHAQARHRAVRLLKCLTPPHRLPSGPVRVSASLGLAVWPDDGDTPDALIAAADLAMYRAKRATPARPRRGLDPARDDGDSAVVRAHTLHLEQARKGGPLM